MDQSVREAFRNDGAVLLKGALNEEELQRCRAAYDWAVANPSPFAVRGRENEGFSDNANPFAKERLDQLVKSLPIGRLFADVWGSEHVWYCFEEIFLKVDGTAGRTKWHQDTSYQPWAGSHWANAWISFESLPKENSLEIVRGSHLGIQYDGINWSSDDPTEPMFGVLPRVPSIDAELAVNPDAYDIISWATEPGDIVMLHPAALHGGAPVDADCPERRTIVFRCFGDDATFRPLPDVDTKQSGNDNGLRTANYSRNGAMFVDEMAKLNEGDPFRSHIFAQLV